MYFQVNVVYLLNWKIIKADLQPTLRVTLCKSATIINIKSQHQIASRHNPKLAIGHHYLNQSKLDRYVWYLKRKARVVQSFLSHAITFIWRSSLMHTLSSVSRSKQVSQQTFTLIFDLITKLMRLLFY